MNGYLDLLTEYMQAKQRYNVSTKQYMILSTYFFTKLYTDQLDVLLKQKETTSDILNEAYQYKNVVRWTNKPRVRKTFDSDFVLIPINLTNSHWILVVIDIKTTKAIYFDDSLPSYDDSAVDAAKLKRNKCLYTPIVLRVCLRWLEDEATTNNISFDKNEWKLIVVPNSLKQNNGIDCGACVLMKVDRIIDELPLVTDHPQTFQPGAM